MFVEAAAKLKLAEVRWDVHDDDDITEVLVVNVRTPDIFAPELVLVVDVDIELIEDVAVELVVVPVSTADTAPPGVVVVIVLVVDEGETLIVEVVIPEVVVLEVVEVPVRTALTAPVAGPELEEIVVVVVEAIHVI